MPEDFNTADSLTAALGERDGLLVPHRRLARFLEERTPPGEVISEVTSRAMARAFRVSRTSICLYLQSLVSAGLIEVIPSGGSSRDAHRHLLLWRARPGATIAAAGSAVRPEVPMERRRSGRAVAFNDFRREVLQLYSPPLRAKATRTKMATALDIAGELGARTVADLTPQLIGEFVRTRPPENSPNTTHSLLRSLRAACAYAVSQGYLKASPFDVRKEWLRRSRPQRRRHHSREEIARVLELLQGEVLGSRGWERWRARRLYALVATVAYTGMRRGEALHLRIEDIDFEAGIIQLVDRRDYRYKTSDSAQPVPMPPPLAAVLRAWVEHVGDRDRSPDRRASALETAARAEAAVRAGGPRWLFPGAVRFDAPWTGGPPGQKPLDQCKAAGERAGVEGFTFLSLRHSWATHAEFWGLSPAMIQRVLRHTSINTQRHYRHADVANLGFVAAAIDFTGRDRPAPPPAPAPGDDQVERLRAEVARLRDQLAERRPA